MTCIWFLGYMLLLMFIMAAGQKEGICFLEVDPGPCEALTYMYYYSAETDTCILFAYGGCLGNDNRFATELECRHTCERGGNRQLLLNACNMKVDHGYCDAEDYNKAGKKAIVASKKYYYDPDTKQCYGFVYSGCRGNDNRFSLWTQCHFICNHRQPGEKIKIMPKVVEIPNTINAQTVHT